MGIIMVLEGDKEDNNLTQEQELEKEDVQEQPQLYVHTQKIPQESDQEHAQEGEWNNDKPSWNSILLNLEFQSINLESMMVYSCLY